MKSNVMSFIGLYSKGVTGCTFARKLLKNSLTLDMGRLRKINVVSLIALYSKGVTGRTFENKHNSCRFLKNSLTLDMGRLRLDIVNKQMENLI